jgi:ATP synthase protein I
LFFCVFEFQNGGLKMVMADKDQTSYEDPNDDERLDRLGQKIAKARGEKHETGPEAHSTLGKGWRLATELVAAPMVAGAMGLGLDRWLGTLPLFLLIGIGIGFAAGMLNVMRAMKEMSPDAGEDKDEEK